MLLTAAEVDRTEVLPALQQGVVTTPCLQPGNHASLLLIEFDIYHGGCIPKSPVCVSKFKASSSSSSYVQAISCMGLLKWRSIVEKRTAFVGLITVLKIKFIST